MTTAVTTTTRTNSTAVAERDGDTASPAQSNQAKDEQFAEWKSVCHANLQLGRIPLIIIGSGVSAAAGVPTLVDVHNYLEGQLTATRHQTKTTEIAINLLKILQQQRESPRSVQVRLYHLLQETAERGIRQLWKEFGKHLLDGGIAQDKPQKLWEIMPSPTHEWVAQLALDGRSAMVSLNYDGLTARAVNAARPNAARILSSAQDVQHYFFDRGWDPSEESSDRSVPVIKFRGDVFHAVCDNGRCPEIARSAPLYDLIRIGHGSAGVVHSADSLLRCPSCGSMRDLRISFPGVFGKERDIDDALAAFHAALGCNFAAFIFLGFSGAWDERLVHYLAGRARQLDLPILSLSRSETPAIELHAQSVGARYLWRRCVFGSTLSAELKGLLPAMTRLASCIPKTDHVFPTEAFTRNEMIQVISRDRSITVTPGDNTDTFTGIGKEALQLPEIKRLERCTQLGPKSAFLRETKLLEHSRYRHSAGATLLAMIWHERLLELRPESDRWCWSKDARLATEMAVLFHDARHLPFSHMMEDVFAELNWGVVANKSWNVPQYIPLVRPNLASDTEFRAKLDVLLAENGVDTSAEIWWSSRVDALHECKSGVPWIDAIVDGALDVDKIEYIFRDTELTGQRVRLRDQRSWLNTFLADQRLTPEGVIRLEGQSCFAALELLEERLHLYRKLYLLPELRALETLTRYIVTTWLEWKVPQQLGIDGWTIYGSGEDLRARKAELAGRLLWQVSESQRREQPKQTEIALLKIMIDELRALNALDPAAEDWLLDLWRHLEVFATAADEGEATLELAQQKYSELAPIGPLYIHNRDYAAVRRIIRSWRVHYPLVAIVDLVQFPKFLATPRVRVAQQLNQKTAHAEQFLVPSDRPSEWRTRTAATVPLHQCDFSGFELPVAQILILDPLGTASGGSSFVHQMLLRAFRESGILVFESAEEAAKA